MIIELMYPFTYAPACPLPLYIGEGMGLGYTTKKGSLSASFFFIKEYLY
jgi:hypothetical protein